MALPALQRIRNLMKSHRVSALVVPTGDPHASEFPIEHWRWRATLCPFTGSAGTLAITEKDAWLWTDSRYWVQSTRQLKRSGFCLMAEGKEGTPRIDVWLASNLPKKSRVAVPFDTVSSASFAKLQATLKERGIDLVDANPWIEALWPERPQQPTSEVLRFERFETPRAEKLAALRRSLADAGCSATLVSALDDVAWLTNLRGSDLADTPLFLAHCWVDVKHAYLFIDAQKIPKDIREALLEDGFQCKPYDELPHFLQTRKQGTILIDPNRTCAMASQAIQAKVHEAISPVALLKSIKTSVQLKAAQRAFIDEGVALVELFAWIRERLARRVPTTECDVVDKLLALRSLSKDFRSVSFSTIAAVDANASEPHYAPTPKSSKPLNGARILLLDSGGQYTTGTTDITRTIALSKPSRELRADFTAVLRGHIAIAKAVFPDGVNAAALDSLARAPIWQRYTDYGHGTGHGVGFGLCVHEGPISISPRSWSKPNAKLLQGQLISNEPGIYWEGHYGIRLENLVTPKATRKIGFLSFATLSVCPFDETLIDRKAMLPDELDWLDRYQAQARRILMPRLSPKAQRYLTRITQGVSR